MRHISVASVSTYMTQISFHRTPCGFCFVEFYTHAEALAALRYVSGTKLDERVIRCDLDLGYAEGRQFGRGKSGGQVRSSNFGHLHGASHIDLNIARYVMNIDRTTMLGEVDGALRRREQRELEGNSTQTLWMGQVLLRVVVVTGRTEDAKVCGTFTWPHSSMLTISLIRSRFPRERHSQTFSCGR